MATLPKPTTEHTGTWLGRPGTERVWQSTPKATGLRVAVKTWDDERGGSYARLVDGDGRTPDFRTLERIDNPTDEQVAGLLALLPTIHHRPTRGR